MEVLTVLAIGLAVGAVTYTVLDTLFSEERRVRRRIAALEKYTASPVAEAEPLAAPFRERVLKPGLSSFGDRLAKMTPTGYMARLRKQVVISGGPARSGSERLLLTKAAAGAAGVAGYLLVAGVLAFRGGLAKNLVMAVLFGMLYFFAPDLVLSSRASSRRRHIVRELPDMLDMLTISVEAGLGFDQAVSRYVRHSRGPLGKEFGIALMEIQAGKSRREALRTMAERVDVPELRTFIMAIVQADVFGVSVSDVLRTQSHEMRLKRRQRAEEIAQKAPAKMAFPLILCILPATIIVVIMPAIIGLMRLFRG